MTEAALDSSAWVDAIARDALRPGSMTTVKLDRHQLVVGLDEGGEPFALDNACPHEGYPLAQGTLKDCTLTCQWHNWKFDVRDGQCLLGGEGVRGYPVRVVDGMVQVEVSDPDPERLWPGLRHSLHDGLFRDQLDRALRDAARLLDSGYDPHRLLVDVARHDARHYEYGLSHVPAVCADARRLLAVRPGAKALHALAPAIELCADANRRMPARERPEPTPGATADRLHDLIEQEQHAAAEAMLRGAFRDPSARSRISGWLYRILGDHFTDFGHQLIYMVKIQELLRDVDEVEAADELYGSLVFSIGTATREDTLPYWRPYREALAGVDTELAGLYARQDPTTPFEPWVIRDAVLSGGAKEAVQSVLKALEQGVPATRIAEALVQAGALRLARFDVELDRRPDVAENWLWATHRFTFASAVRNAVRRFPSPHALRFLFQAVGFIHSGAPMDGADRTVETGAAAATADAEGTLQALRAKDAAAAVAGARACLADPAEAARLQLGLEELALADPLVRPILHAHAIKTTVAAWEESEQLGVPADAALPVLAAVRFLASPITQKRTREMADLALSWVIEGKRPKKLTQ